MSEFTPPLEFKDKRTGLKVFGILLIICGVFALLMIPAALLGVMLSGHVPGIEPLPLRSVVPGIFVFLAEAIVLVWLGIGSILRRRWARALIMVVGWYWMFVGATSLIMNVIMLPRIVAISGVGPAAASPAILATSMTISIAVGALINIVWPAVLILFFRNPNVKATCESADPKVRWTDKCPLPVLGLSLFLVAGATMMPVLVLMGYAVVPFFGHYLTGAPATIILLAQALIYAFAAHAAYKLKPFAWWFIVAVYGVITISFLITFARLGLVPMYEAVGYPVGQLLRLKQTGLIEGPGLLAMSAFYTLVFFGFLAFTKRFFRKSNTQEE